MDQDFRDKLLMDLSGTQQAMTVQITEIKEDLKEHIKRSNQNEILIRNVESKQAEDISYVKKHIYLVQGAIGLLGIIATAVGVLKYFQIF